jgi:hypothetical protein
VNAALEPLAVMGSAGRGPHHFTELEVLWTPQASLDRRVDRLHHLGFHPRKLSLLQQAAGEVVK